MRRPSFGEIIAGGTILAVISPLFGCGGSEQAAPPEGPAASVGVSPESGKSPTVRPNTLRAIGAVVINGKDRLGNSVGVRSYVSPWTSEAKGVYPEGAGIEVFCTVTGRTAVDNDVPPGTPAIRSTKWYKLNSGLNDWMGEGYVRPSSSVPACPPDLTPPSPSVVALPPVGIHGEGIV